MNHNKITFALLAALVGAPAIMAGTSCTNQDSTLQYTTWQKDGGAAPFEGMVIGERTWTYKGKILSQEQSRYLAQGTEMDIESTVVPGSYVVLSTVGTQAYRKVTYKETVTLTRKSGEAVYPDSDAKQVSENLVCTDYTNKIPIP